MKFLETEEKENLVQPATICYRCEHFWRTNEQKPWSDIWYSHRCLASPVKQEISPVTGKPEYVGEHLYEFCRDINKGNCPKFKQK